MYAFSTNQIADILHFNDNISQNRHKTYVSILSGKILYPDENGIIQHFILHTFSSMYNLFAGQISVVCSITRPSSHCNLVKLSTLRINISFNAT